MNPEKMRDSLKEMIREVVREEMGGQGNFLYGTYVSPGATPGRHNISILDESFSNIPALTSVGTIQPGDTVVCIRSRAMPLTIIGRLGVGSIPGERIATTRVTSDSSTFTTTETVVMTVVAPVVSGRTYRITADVLFETTAANTFIAVRIREGSVSGTNLRQSILPIPTADGRGVQMHMTASYTADATENKTFVLTGQRTAGTGTSNLVGGAASPSFLYVEYIEG